MSVVTPSDFESGVFKIGADTYGRAQLQAVIDQWEGHYLAKLFGVELYKLYLEDPEVERFEVITDAFIEQATGCGAPIYESYGLTDMLCGFMFFHFVRDSGHKSTSNGDAEPEAEAASIPPAGRSIAKLQDAWNRAIQSYQAIQWYMRDSEHAADYPEFNGIAMNKMFLGGAI